MIAADVEGTLTVGETWKGMAAWMRAYGRAAQYQGFFNRNLPGAILARLGFGNKREFQNRFMEGVAGLLAGLSEAELKAVGVWVAKNELWPKRRQNVIAELLGRGEPIVLCSATFQPVLEAFATLLGAGTVALGTPLELRNGVFTGRVVGGIRSGPSKASQLREYLDGQRLSAAYGDTLPDHYMLELAQNPVAVHPDPGLLRLARAKGWRILVSS
ncbi:MAG: HAD family hydrolase [Meiothermus sp.]